MDRLRNANRIPLTYYQGVINLPKTLNTILLVMTSSGILIDIALISVGASSDTIVSITVFSLLSALLILANKKGYHKPVAFGAFLLVCSVLAYNSFKFNGVYDVGSIAYPAVIIFASLLLGYQFVWPVTLVVLAVIATIYKLSLIDLVTPFDGMLPTQSQDFWTIITAIIITGLLVFIIMSIVDHNVKQILVSEARLQKAYESTLQGWARALELRDHETEGHSQRVTQLTVKLGQKMGIPEEELKFLRWGALLHDIGKMAIPDSILLKKGRLTRAEFETIKQHPDISKKLLQGIPYLEKVVSIPHLHHERWDGSGYPLGLRGENIPLPARIFAVIDVWDALISPRPYKAAWTNEEACSYIKEQAGILFDPQVISAFFDVLDKCREDLI